MPCGQITVVWGLACALVCLPAWGLASQAAEAADPVRVVIWDEQQPAQKQAYENFLGNCVADHLKALPGLVAYSMSKAAVGMMTKGLARDWARHHIAVNALCPGVIRTELNSDWFESEGGQKQVQGFPRRRLGQESDLDALLLLLCSQHASFVTGSLFTVDDGQLRA